MKTTVKRVTLPIDRRVVAISDIHGHCGHLEKLLEKITFSTDDVLFIVGDIIEKGPESLRTLRYVMDLCKTHTVYPSMGNVDAWRLVMFDDVNPDSCKLFVSYVDGMRDRWGGCLFTDMMEELGIDLNSPNEVPYIKARLAEAFADEFSFLRSLPTIIETNNFIFVHGGIPHSNLNKLVGTDVFEHLKYDAFMEEDLSFSKYVVVGHWPVTLYNDKITSSRPIIDHDRRIISLDGGCGLKLDGSLNALLIQNAWKPGEALFSFEDYNNYPIARAATEQAASSKSINIRFTDNKIRIIEKGDEFSVAEHLSTGYRLPILNSFIHSNNLRSGEFTTCEDYTDYMLPTSRGDILSVIQSTTRGYLVKKGGISGWFCGQLEY